MASPEVAQDLSLLGKAAIITGASRGIGAQIALEFARRGANIAIAYHSDSSTDSAQDVATQIRALSRRATLIKVDLRGLESGETIVKAAREGLEVDKIDILVNNAGADAPPSTAADFDPTVFETTMNINVRAPLLILKALLPHIATRDARIINISSTLARLPAPGNLAVYGSSKAALESLTRHWAFELAQPHNLTVNTISIGIIETDSSAHYNAVEREELSLLPSAARRLGTVDDVAPVAAFLASESARWINGATVSCNGGSLFM